MKKISAMLLPAAAALMLAACGGPGKGAPSAADAASGLLASAGEQMQRQAPDSALALLDSLTRRYPGETEAVRRAMLLRPQAMEMQARQAMARCDSLIADAERLHNAVKGKMRWVSDPRMVEGYWVDASAWSPAFMNSTGIQARVSEIGRFYVVSSVNPGAGHTAVALADGAAVAATPAVARDGESNYSIGGGEVITFSPEQSDTLGRFASLRTGRPLTLTFTGRSRRSLTLTPRQVEAIANAYTLSRAMEQARDNTVLRQKYERQAALAASQAERLGRGDVPVKKPAQ